jgi:hypothetical protein
LVFKDLSNTSLSCRFMYGETLGKWRTADLLIGLAYLAQRGTEEHPASDIAEHGDILGLGLPQDARSSLVVSFHSTRLLKGTVATALQY